MKILRLTPAPAARGVFAVALIAAAMLLSGTDRALACPDWTQNGAALGYSSDDLWTPRTHAVTAGGNYDLAGCPGIPGNGWVVSAPDFTMQFSGNSGARRALEFRVTGNCDTVLLVNDAGAGWHFSDDADGTVHPRLRLAAAPDGLYDVWVGTYGSATCAASLTIETF